MNIRPRLVVIAACLFTFIPSPTLGGRDRVQQVVGTPTNRAVVVNTYPEYWVDGKPFFAHSAAFFYQRIPRDRWAEELARLRAMGINTIDLCPIWNWHQPEESVLDFEGRTSPRRDLKYLLRLISVMGFKLTIRPGPFSSSDWRNGGYPDWLLRRSEYDMSEQAVLEGRYPRYSALQYEKSEEAASAWLDNETHLKYTRKWYRDVLALVNPLLADKGGPLINIQIDDDQAMGRENYSGPDFWKYMDTLRKYAKEATHDARLPYYLNGGDMRVNAEANTASSEPFWNTGQDYQRADAGGYSTVFEAAKNKLLTELLKTQPLFVPAVSEFQAGWLLDEKDTYAPPTHPTNTLMATRVMFQNGLKGLSYFPANDSLYPAGYEAPWANYFYTWEAAVNYAGQETGRAPYVRRNGRLLAGMGPFLASVHFAADAGLVYPMATFPQPELTAEEASYVADVCGRVLWSGVYDHYNLELVDSDHAPLANFQRYQILLLPNLVSTKEELKRFPHLERYSEKAQRVVAEYVAVGGTLIVFPSLPKGKIFDEMLEPLGKARQLAGNAPLKWADGTTTLALGSRTVLTLPKKRRTEVKVFARDARGGVVGARFTYGRGQILFFGADFSLWSAPPGTTLSLAEGGAAGPRDYTEDVQKAGRPALAALLKMAGARRNVYPEMETTQARDLGLYVTELIADPHEQLDLEQARYAFVGVTNFSVEEARTAEITLTDPRAENLAPGAAGRYLRLPRLTMPPRESLMLPIRVPLRNSFWEVAPGLVAGDEIYYATAELSRVAYDGTKLQLQFTAPTEGEVALRLAEPPQGAQVDSAVATVQENTEQHLYVVKIPKGEPPHFVRTVELRYPRKGPNITIDARGSWIAGETRAVRVQVENPLATVLEGELDFVAGTIYRPGNPPLSVHIPARSSREFSFPVEIPVDVATSQPVELVASFRERNSSIVWGWRSEVTIHRPFDYLLGPVQHFPLREDQPIPIVRPILVGLDLPGEARLSLWVKNWLDHEQIVTLTAEGTDIAVTPTSSQLVLPAQGETTVELRAAPAKGSGAYRFEVRLHAGPYQVREGVLLAALAQGEAIAYSLDFDRDGSDDIVLENRELRCFVSPRAGGRSFALMRKESNSNAFNSVGGMRDSFATRFEPDDMKSVAGWTRRNWLGLYNRHYAFHIVSSAGPEAGVHLEYVAPDIYPKGVKLERTLTLAGDQNVVVAESSVTPYGIEKKRQAYVLENSVPFRSFDEPNYAQWFTSGHPKEEFVPQRRLELGVRSGFVGTVNKKTGETFALMVLTPAERSQMAVENHSALLRVIYPAFTTKNEAYSYRVGYYFGKESLEEVEKLFAKLKARG
jgi:hypothetical protein